MKIKRVIIWGYAQKYNTYMYIHSSFYKAFKSMGYDTLWVDDEPILIDKYSEEYLKGTLFLTVGGADTHIPVINNCAYFVHNGSIDKYKNTNSKAFVFYNYARYCQMGASWVYIEKDIERNVAQGKAPLEGLAYPVLEKINNTFFYDEAHKACYVAWGTDLLPWEIDTLSPVTYDPSKTLVYYVGTVTSDNMQYMNDFSKICTLNGRHFRTTYGIPDDKARELVRESYIAPDIRTAKHIEWGYIPCRIVKNMSYGKIAGTNSPYLREIFGDMIAYGNNPEELFEACEEKEKSATTKSIRDAMNFVRNNHTYINKANDFLYLLRNG